MAKEIEIFQIDAFTGEAFLGNPAGVTFSNDLSEDEMKLIAREMNLSETAFISNSNSADYKLRWFTPTKEVDLCGHATIASLHYLFEKGKVSQNQNIKFETRSGIINCSITNGKYLMQLPLPHLSEFDGCKEEILDALDLERLEVSDLPFIILDNGYLFICVKSLKSLQKIKPDFKKLKFLSESKKEFFDLSIFTTETIEYDSAAHIRFFAPYHGIDEDPVTGSACGPLLLVLIKLGLVNNYIYNSFVKIEQGDTINRKGRVDVKFNYDTNELFIAGKAVSVFKGRLKY